MEYRETITLKDGRTCILRNGTVDANTAALSKMYTVDDNLMTVFKFINGKSTVYSFTEAPVEYSL